jgi:N-acetylglucosaminyldiphosphoundecaprenol N-acetyl-beta-D-mannosaminyltransferase
VANILGVKVDLVSCAQTLQVMDSAIQSARPLAVSFVNVYSIMTSRRDALLREAINGSSLAVADGMPLVWISRWTDAPLSDRVYGPDLFESFCTLADSKAYSYFFYGSSPAVLSALTRKIRDQFPRIRIAGALSPPYREITADEEARFIDEINRSNADVLWIGLGSPKQEKWMHSVRHRVRVPVLAAIGAAFDFHAGSVRQAPKRVQKMGLEWLFRLLMEPRRLWKRYLLNNPGFVLLIFKEIISDLLFVGNKKGFGTAH